jgi:hypothetical protein
MVTATHAPAHTGRIFPKLSWNPAQIGGIAGFAFAIVFIIGALVLQRESPAWDAELQDIRAFWNDHSNRYLVGDWLIFGAFVLFFLPFVSALRSTLAPRDPSGGLIARLIVVGGITGGIMVAVASLPWGALALTGASDVDDSTLRLAMNMEAYGMAMVGWWMAAFILPASILILLSAALPRWVGALGLLEVLLAVVGSLWVVGGDQDGVLYAVSLASYLGWGIWSLAVCVSLLRKRPEEAVTPAAAA